MKGFNIKIQIVQLLFITVLSFMCFRVAYAQPALPQRSITVTASQPIHFGVFCITGGGGGSITVGYDGSKSSSGDIVLLSISPMAQPAIFEVKLCQGRNVIITFASSTILYGSNGGTLTLDIGPTEKGPNGASFPSNYDCNFITPLRVGGTLHVPGTALPGTYTGSFDISFNQE